MLLKHIVTAHDSNHMYVSCIPAFIKAWKHLFPTASIHIVVINNEKINWECLGAITHHVTVSDLVPTAFAAQYVRLLFPGTILNEQGGAVLISDADMMPLNRTYYSRFVSTISDDYFVNLRGNVVKSFKEYAMCYNVATPKIWSRFFPLHDNNISKTIECAFQRVSEYVPYGTGWCTDQKTLYDVIEKNKNIVILGNDKQLAFTRLDRLQSKQWAGSTHINKTLQMVKDGYFCDYHMLRPYDNYLETNNAVLESVLLQTTQ